MANVERANREFDQRAVFGLGADNQAEDLFDAEGLVVTPDGERRDAYAYTFDAAEPNEYTQQDVLNVYGSFPGETAFDDSEDAQDIGAAIFARADFSRTEAFSPGEYGGEIYGVYSEAIDTSTIGAGATGVWGVSGTGYVTQAADLYAIGVAGAARALGTATGVELIGVDGVATHFNSSETTALKAIRAFPFIAGTGTIVDYYGLDVNGGAVGGKTATNAYGIFIKDHSALGSVIANNIHSAGATSNNYFQGHVEIDGNLNHDGAGVGFYGTAPVAKQTGVAVDAAAIHAALVALGLIGA